MSSTTGERLRAWLILERIRGVGPRVAGRLIEQFGDPIRVLAAGRAELQATGLKPALVDAVLDPPEAAADADLAWAEGEGVRILRKALGAGPDRVYPAAHRDPFGTHRDLARRIAENGALCPRLPTGAEMQIYVTLHNIHYAQLCAVSSRCVGAWCHNGPRDRTAVTA